MSELENGSKEENQTEQFREVTELSFDEIKRGDEIHVFTNQYPDQKEYRDVEITINVTGIRKAGLQTVLVSPRLGIPQNITARMPGGFRAIRPDQPRDFTPGVTPGVIKVATTEEENCLYFENLKQQKGQDNPGDSKAMRTAAIRRILIKQI